MQILIGGGYYSDKRLGFFDKSELNPINILWQAVYNDLPGNANPARKGEEYFVFGIKTWVRKLKKFGVSYGKIPGRITGWLDKWCGKGPMGIAAASLYVAALLTGEKRTQREVADVAGVTEVTIRNRYKELLEELGLEENVKEIKDRKEVNTEE